MTFLSKLLGRQRRAPGGDTDPASHIARALNAAGLSRDDGSAGPRATIDRALAQAGLLAPSDRSREVNAPGADTGERAGGLGTFLHASSTGPEGRLDYRLYLPLGYEPQGPARPLVLMLHGCTQSPEDFAVGTRMNVLADRHGFLVAYPRQTGKANHAKCWNWFRPDDQRGDAGEPASLADLAASVVSEHRVDPRRVFVAGLSAGAAMAVVLGRTRPDVVRAIGVHSGLPYACAHDVPSALAAMQGRASAPARPDASAVPAIVFHGDADRTVVPRNGEAVVASAMRPDLRVERGAGVAAGGRRYTREVAVDADGRAWIEHWTVHGAGHAWSGGDAAGTFTDPEGPDASAAMVDFFLRQ